ncbi:Hypothetical protein RAK1035_1026 [Roseovarius sp. AK1035]|nr:Hypothetical protein RAK1035_1026 [Roseovarius sp. AK1035]
MAFSMTLVDGGQAVQHHLRRGLVRKRPQPFRTGGAVR